MKPQQTERPFVLIGESVYNVAERSRRAVLEFFAGTNAAWGRRDLAKWLVESYANAAQQSAASMIISRLSQLRRPERRVEESDVASLLYRTRESALEVLQLRAWERAEFAQSALSARLVAGAYDGIGGIGYVAVARPGMLLFDRVMSLLVADCLTRPGDYASLRVCDSCGEVSFDWEPSHLESCEERPRASGVVPRWAATVRGVGECQVG